MNLSDLAIRRPIFITCIFILILGLGYLSLKRLGVDLYPDVNFPVVVVKVPYKGAGPKELETLVTKPIEDQLSTLSGIKTITSTSEEGVATITAQFRLNVNVNTAEQKVSERLTQIRPQLPKDIDDPSVGTFDPSDMPILEVALTADLPEAKLYDLADQSIRPQLEEVNQVGLVDIDGGRKREIQVLLDESKLKTKKLSATDVVRQIALAGQNTPAGKIDTSTDDTLVRTLGDFTDLASIKNVVVKFLGNEVTTRVGDVAQVSDGLEDEKTRTYVNGQSALTLMVYRQSGANTVAVTDAVVKKINSISSQYKGSVKGFKMAILWDGAKPIRDSIHDVGLTIYLGVILTVLVVLFFLGNIRSTLITGIALPNSLLGAFVLMAIAGFTLNVMSLMALSLAVGLLIDDAIVVRENIFRRLELGEPAKTAASEGAKEVTLAVIATTLVVLSVFGPVAFLRGIVGQFFKQFGLTICFAMLISLFDSLTMAPMLSAYFAAAHSNAGAAVSRAGSWVDKLLGAMRGLQKKQEAGYLRMLHWTLRHPLLVIASALVIFLASFLALKTVSKTFVPAEETGEFEVVLDMPAGTSLEAMDQLTRQIDQSIRSRPEVRMTVQTTGGFNNEPNQSSIIVMLQPMSDRHYSTNEMKDIIRKQLKVYSQANPKVEDLQGVGGEQQQPFTVNITGENLADLKSVSDQLLALLKSHGDLQDVDSSYRTGQPELEVVPDQSLMQRYGVLSTEVGNELRTLIAGTVPAKFRENGNEYDIRVRLQSDQRDLQKTFQVISIPNLNGRLIPLKQVAKLVANREPPTILREDRARYVQISADINPHGRGMAAAIQDVNDAFSTGKIKLPPGVSYKFVGSSQDFQDLMANVIIALGLAVLFIYLVLSSLYESFFIPLAIMLVLPLAACGAFYALAITRSSLDIFSMIGCILLLGVATKNSILLVDHIQQSVRDGRALTESIVEAGRVRLRPILMTSFALIAGMLPVAIPVTETAKQRTSMGIAVIGGLITSTLLSLVVVPAAYSYIDRFEKWVIGLFNRLTNKDPSPLS